ncbi:YlzJ-like family protein [Bacillus salitolerans]|uniref:YlzJ-like family protein n=1 Tax=Bacillus salitolerans TaxID=1437434 RepID=A0ABW4LL00_9BACI
MILYTVMPQEVMFPMNESDFQNQQLISMNGVSLLVERTDNQDYRVIRCLSTDPQHFLCEQYAPGNLISN